MRNTLVQLSSSDSPSPKEITKFDPWPQTPLTWRMDYAGSFPWCLLPRCHRPIKRCGLFGWDWQEVEGREDVAIWRGLCFREILWRLVHWRAAKPTWRCTASGHREVRKIPQDLAKQTGFLSCIILGCPGRPQIIEPGVEDCGGWPWVQDPYHLTATYSRSRVLNYRCLVGL